jgi:tetratricopeptide (TPR) repeat protein
VKAAKEKATKQKAKDREQKMDLALNIKISKKREKWSNESMLKKRWSVPRKQFQNLFTHYNYYFNADRKMDEAIANMLRARREGYDSLLALFPYNPDTDSMLLKPDMDSIIQKASVGIQIHDPRTQWGDDLYLLLGQAFYYKGDYENASTAFRYIVSLRELYKKNKSSKSTTASSKTKGIPSIVEAEKTGTFDFLQHQPVHNEALLWLARTYTQSKRYGDAESVLDLLIADPAFPESLKGRFALERAYLAMSTGNTRGATGPLTVVAKDGSQPTWLRQRAAFLSGQLLQAEGKYTEAAERYGTVVDLHPKIEMDFQARKNRAYALMAAGGEQSEAIASLRSLLKDGKYAPYYEQVYYVLGRLSANSGQAAMAEEYLNKSLSSAKSTRRQRALSFAALGDVYYSTAAYERAQASYDSAAYLAGKAAGTDPIFIAASKKAQTLTAVAGPARILHIQDSLLTLSAMTEKEQRAVVRKYIKTLASQKADSAARAEAGAGIASNDVVDAGAGDNNWYFASTTTLRQGFNDFKRKWGNRPATDNWRRASAASFAANGSSGNDAGGTGSAGAAVIESDASGLPTEESLLAAIPRGEAGQNAARQRIRRAYVDLATAYTKDVEDYQRATKSLDDLDRRFPGHEYQAEALYLGYLIFLRQNQIERAQSYAAQLMEKYPGSSYAALVRPVDETDGPLLASTAEASGYYEETYDLVQKREFTDALRRSREGQQRWSQRNLVDRFRILEAMSLAGTGAYDRADTVLDAFLASGPSDSLRSWAETVKSFVKRSRPAPVTASAGTTAGAPVPQPVGSNPGTPTTSAPASNSENPPATNNPANGTLVSPAVVPTAFTYKASAPHFFVFMFPKMEARTMGVKAGLTDLNSFKFSDQALQPSVEMLSGNQGFIVVKTFASAAKAKAYLAEFRKTPALLREYKSGEGQVFLISEANYQKVLADRSVGAYMQFYKKNY